MTLSAVWPERDASLASKPEPAARESASVHTHWTFWLVAMALTGVFFAAEHDWHITETLVTLEEQFEELGLEDTIDSGSLGRRLAYIAFAGLGSCLLLAPARRPLRQPGALVWMMVAYFGVCLFSITWSDAPDMTARRVIQLLCFGVGIFGLARYFDVRELTKLVLVVTVLNLAIGIVAEISLGMFNVQAEGYRFAGTIHPNTQGINCALLALAAFALIRHTRRNLPLLLGLIAFAVLFLFLTRSRTSNAAFLASVSVQIFLKLPSRGRWLFALWVPASLFALFAADTLLDHGPSDQVRQIAMMGRDQHESKNLSGRTELWGELMDYYTERPMLGFGYGAFWTGRRVREISKSQGWEVPHAHNGFFEVLGNIGMVGLLLFAGMVTLGLWQSWRAYQQTQDEGYRFLLAQLTLGLVNSVADAYYALPSFCAGMCAASLASMAWTRREEEVTENRAQGSSTR